MISSHLSKFFSSSKYNIIILAGGLGTRMGDASRYIPKALSSVGQIRAIDHILTKYDFISHRVIIGISAHADLLSSYVTDRYAHLNVAFVNESMLLNTSRSAALCLDNADSQYPTIIQFCDLILEDPLDIEPDSLFIATEHTKGVVGTFRHGFYNGEVVTHLEPVKPNRKKNGLCGLFTFSNTPLLKSIAYSSWKLHADITDDIVRAYNSLLPMSAHHVREIYEFGSESDLRKVNTAHRYHAK